jgi:hypothetical protein
MGQGTVDRIGVPCSAVRASIKLIALDGLTCYGTIPISHECAIQRYGRAEVAPGAGAAAVITAIVSRVTFLGNRVTRIAVVGVNGFIATLALAVLLGVAVAISVATESRPGRTDRVYACTFAGKRQHRGGAQCTHKDYRGQRIQGSF